MNSGLDLERGRIAYAPRSWTEAYGSLSSADQADPLGAEDLELLAVAAHMVGREDERASVLEREHQLHITGQQPRADPST